MSPGENSLGTEDWQWSPQVTPQHQCVTCWSGWGEVCVLSSLVGKQLVRRQTLEMGPLGEMRLL